MISSDYQMTFGYGLTDPPYGTTQYPYHRGDDWYMPEGIPIVVNGVQIGISGMTGFVDGPHVHVGKWVGGKDKNPQSQAWTLDNPRVSEVGYDTTNGNFVALVDAANVRWVYLHMKEKSTNVKVGDYLDKLPKYEREDMPSTVGDVEIDQMSWAYFGYGSPSDSQFTKDNLGRESNEFERFMFAHPVAQAYRKQVSQWRSKAESTGNPIVQVDGVPYVPKK